MSRVPNNPLTIPSGIEINLNGNVLTVKGSKTTLTHEVHPAVKVTKEESSLRFVPVDGVENADAFAGTARALVNNMITGLSKGFEKKLSLVGVGYKAQLQGKKLVLNLGFSHPINYQLPEGIAAETPSQTEIVIKGVDKQLVGQVAAEIRAFRPPEPYKGKGVKYSDEHIVRKEGKKK